MMLIRLCLATLAAAPMALAAICGACCRWMTPPAVALPRPRGEWYPRTLPREDEDWLPVSPGGVFVHGHYPGPPLPEPPTRPLPAATETELQIAQMWAWAQAHGVDRPA